MKKRIFALLLAFVMLVGVLPVRAFAADVPVSGGRVDITDTAVGSYTLQYLDVYLQNTYEAVKIVSATQNGTTINVVLSEDTDPSAALQAGFGGSGQGMLSHSGNKCTLSNGSGSMAYAVTVRLGPQVTGSATFTVNFTVPMGEVCTVTPPAGEGFTFTGKETVYKDSAYSFRIAVKEGYDGTNMVVKVNGDPMEGTAGTYTVESVSGDLTITVEGIVKKEVCTVKAPEGEGFTFNGATTVYKGEGYTFTISVAEGFDGTAMAVKANGESVSGTDGSYTIPTVNEDTVLTVEGIVKKEVCTVKAPEGEGFTFSGPAWVYKGEGCTFTVSVEEGYDGTAMTVKANGEIVGGTDGSYTIPAVNEDTVLTVEGIVKKEVCTVKAPEGEGFTFSGAATVYKGEGYTFTVSVAEGYDGSAMTVKANGETVSGTDGSYTIPAVNEDTVLTVEGVVKKEICKVTLPSGKGYTVTGAAEVYKGESYTFTVTVARGYDGTAMEVKANGESVSGTNGSYTIPAVSGDTVITVEGVTQAPLPEKELPVADNVIDITDKTVYTLTSSYYAKAVNIAVTGAAAEGAYEDGTTVYIVLSSDTADDAQIGVTFGTALSRCTMSGHTGSITLTNGEGTLAMTLTGTYRGSLKASAAYTLIFLREEADAEVPVRVKAEDSAELYRGKSLTLDLEAYYTGARVYCLVDGETKTPIDGKQYTFLATTAGEHKLVFAAQNDVGECPDTVTVTITVKDVSSGVWLGYETSNGSVDNVEITNTEGDPIEGVTVDFANNKITVILPKTYDPSGKVTATFTRSANGADLPFLTPSNAFNNAYSRRTDVYTDTLSGGAAVRTVYVYNSEPKAVSNNPVVWTIAYSMRNDLPVLAEDVSAAAAATITAGESYTLDLAPLFTDADGDPLTYLVSIDGAAAVAAETSYSYTTDTAGTYTLVFTANDGKGTSAETFTVTLTVENAEQTDSMTVYLPAGLEPQFSICSGYDADGVDTLGDPLTAEAGETADGMTAYTVQYPVNVTVLSVRTSDWGGMSFSAEENGSVSFRRVTLSVVDYDENAAESTNTVTCGAYRAVAGSNGWLLVTGREYTYTAVPKDTATLATVTETELLEEGAEVLAREMTLNIKNPIAITVPDGAKAQLYNIDTNKYYVAAELDAKIVTDNDDATTTFFFIGDTKASGSCFVYRVTMEGKITKVGYLDWGKQSAAVTYTDADASPSYRLDDYTGTGTGNSGVTEDSVLLNINSRNNLSMTVGETKTLKAYRAWEIIKVSYQNYILTPDFTYTILSGEDVVSLTEKKSPSTADGDWMTLTALKEGTAVIEVTCNALDVIGGNYDGTYGASDPARTGLVVVQVGSANDASVDFGIDCFASLGTVGSGNVSYNENNKKAWDAEFDTLYFIGSNGKLKLTPSASDGITEVAVSHDKGETWKILTADGGTYTAPIVSGNNIIRVKTGSGISYQVVRGDQVSVVLREVDGLSDGDGTVEAGETIRVSLIGLHNPIPKMAGNYNPGFGGNSDGYSSQHLNYTANGTAIHGAGAQYNFISAANFVDIVMPEDGSSVTLTNGYIGLGVIGLTNFTDGGDSHRNIPDSGCGTRGSQSTFHTRSILPDIIITAGGASAPNAAPVVRADAVTEGAVYDDQKFPLNPDTLFWDEDGNPLSFTVSVNGGTASDIGTDYMFVPEAAGTYTLTFTASDGKETAQHKVTVTVTERPQEEERDDLFGLEESEIAGYVTVSFEDFGVRVEGEKGLKYPAPLGVIIAPVQVPFKQGENVAQVTKRLLDHMGIGMMYSGSLTGGFYLGGITNFEANGAAYGSMAEFDAGVGSGWMVTLNGWFINKGASEFSVKDGDVVKWCYTCQLGADIGDTSYYGSVTEVIKLINAIGTVSADSGDKIKAAREAYDKLSENDKKRVTNYQKLTDAEAAYEAVMDGSVEAVEKLIDAIGTVTLTDQTAIEAARSAYNALPTAQKLKVGNYSKLTDAEARYAELKEEEDKKAADALKTLIDTIKEGSATFEDDVKAAQEAYEKLTAEQKKLVDNYYKLANYLKQLANQEDVEAAEAVEKQIEDLGEITLDSEEAIKAAREAYDKLTDEQKALVGNLNDLKAAEEQLEKLKDAAIGENIYKTTGDYLEKLGTPAPGSIGGEWMVIGLIRSGREVSGLQTYCDSVTAFVRENIDENERLHHAKSTENSRLILALTALGMDVTDVDGHNLLRGLTDMEFVRKQGINGPIWALIAFDSGNYPVPEGGDVTREALIRAILEAQLPDGGWALSGSTSDPDMTGMALQALAPYCNTDADVKKAVDTALIYLSDVQQADGSFSSIDGKNIESIAQVVTALSALGINADQDPRFVRDGVSALDALCAFYVEGGGFRHTPDGKLDGMATEQGYYALAAYFRMLDGKTALYDMTDVLDMGGDVITADPNAQPDAETAVTVPAETQPEKNESAAEREESPAKNGRSFPWWLVALIAVLAGAIVVLVIISRPKKGRHVK